MLAAGDRRGLGRLAQGAESGRGPARPAALALAEREELALRLAELDRLDPRPGEEEALAGERALLGAAEKALADINAAGEALGGDALSGRLAQAFRALERARDRAIQAGAAEQSGPVQKIIAAAAAVDRALSEAQEATAAVDAAGQALEFEPDRLEKAEERLFALRALARKLGTPVEALPDERRRIAQALHGLEDAEAAQAEADKAARAAHGAYLNEAAALSRARMAAGEDLSDAVNAELPPLKLEKARFRVAVEPLAEDRAGPAGLDRVEFQVCTNAGATFGPLGAIASGGELARLALALKAALATREDQVQPLMIFDEVDQGVGGAVADAVGLRLKRLAAQRPGPGGHPQSPGRRPRGRPLARDQVGRRVRAHGGGRAGPRGPRGGDRADARRRGDHRGGPSSGPGVDGCVREAGRSTHRIRSRRRAGAAGRRDRRA